MLGVFKMNPKDLGSHQGASGEIPRGRIGFQAILRASNLCSCYFQRLCKNFFQFLQHPGEAAVFCISYRKQSKYGMPKRCNYVKGKEGGKWWLKISMLESLGRARLSSNSGWTETCLARACLHGASTGRPRVKAGNGPTLLWGVQFTSLIFFFWAEFLFLAQNSVFILASMTYFLGIFGRAF